MAYSKLRSDISKLYNGLSLSLTLRRGVKGNMRVEDGPGYRLAVLVDNLGLGLVVQQAFS